MDMEITFGQVEDCIRRANKYIKEIRLFDVYEGGQIPEGKKSMAYTITFAPKEEAFNAEEVQKFVDKICRTLKNDLDIDLRAWKEKEKEIREKWNSRMCGKATAQSS